MYSKSDSATNFHCDKCNLDKVSKTRLVWKEFGNETENTICNTCYNEICELERANLNLATSSHGDTFVISKNQLKHH